MPTRDPRLPQPSKKHKPKAKPKAKPNPIVKSPVLGAITGGGGELRPTHPRRRKPKPKPAPFSPAAAEAQRRAEAKAAPAPVAKADAQVISRQRTLVAHGYHVVVDGVWGPASQAAWNTYQRSLRPTATPVEAHRHGETANVVPIHSAQAADQARARSEAAVVNGRVMTANAAERAAIAKATREAPALAAAVQQAHGHRDDVLPAQHALRQLHDRRVTALALSNEKVRAVHAAARALKKRPEDLTTAELVAITVDPLTGHFNPGVRTDVLRVQRWLKSHGHPHLPVTGNYDSDTNTALVKATATYHAQQEEHARRIIVSELYGTNTIEPGDKNFPVLGVAPKPGELLDLLRAGGFTAQLVFNALLERALAPGPRFLAWRDSELRRLTRTLYGPFGTPGFLQSKNATVVAATIASDPRFALDPTGHSVGAEQVMALAASRSPEQFGAKLNRINAQAESRFHTQQADRSKDHHWWGAGVLDLISKPSQWLSSGVEAIGADVAYDFRHPGNLLNLQRSDEENQAIAVSVAQFQAAHPYVNLGLQMALDPTWLLPGVPFTKLGRLGALAATRAERLGVIIAAGGEHYLPGRVAIGGAFVLPAATGRTARALGYSLVRGTNPLARLTQVDHLVNGAKLATAQKTEMIGRVRSEVRHAQRVLFRSRPGAPEFRHLSDIGNLIRNEIDLFSRKVLADSHAVLPELHKALREQGISLAADAGYSADSNVGGMLFARIADSLRTIAIQQLAVEEAYSRVAAKIGDLGGQTLGEALAALSPAERAAVLQEAKLGYRATISKAGTYFAGGGDAKFNLILDDRVSPLLDRARGLFSVVQHDLEDAALIAGRELFDESGHWIARTGTAAELLRGLGAAAYKDSASVTIRNANHAFSDGTLRYFTRDEANELVQSELRRYESHLRGYAARENAAGRARTNTWAEDKLAERKAELDKRWVEDTDGQWHDTRPELEVPSIYLRALDRLYRDVPAGLLERGDLPEGLLNLASIAVNPNEAITNPLDRELERLAFALSGGSPRAGELADTMNFPALRDFALSEGHAQLSDHLVGLGNALGRGYDSALPRAMLRNFAVWQALLHAQSAPLRFAAKATSAWLDVWLTLTLPFRPGFVVRNVVDNTVKALVAGARDPRYYFPLYGAKAIRSVFDLDVAAMRYALSLGGRFQQNPALHYFDRVLDTFWDHEPAIVQKVFEAHAIPVPESIVGRMRSLPPDTATVFKPLVNTRNFLWELMAAKPENYARRRLYREAYYKAIQRGATEEEAFETGRSLVAHTLFDYSKETVIEDNLRVIFPFVQFWRKTAQFWITESFDKPWLPVEFALLEDRMQNDLHADWPDWMRRYVHTDVMTDALARVPGLKWLLPGLQAGAITDPANFFSFNVLYKTFKNENPNLPADKAGWAFLAPFIDALNDWGLSMNPLLRKPAEIAGVFNFRAWQSVFPETDLLDALSRRFWRKRHPEGLNLEAWLEDRVLNAIGSDFSVTDRIEQTFNQYVQMEMADQALRGEPVDRDAAVQKIQDHYAVRAILGFFGGLYVRRMTPSDESLYNIIDEQYRGTSDYQDLTPDEQKAVNLFRRRKMDPVAFDRYVEALPAVEAYYALGDYQKGEQFKRAHPDVIPYVDPAWRGKPYSTNYSQTVALILDTQAAIKMYDLVDELDVSQDVRRHAEVAFVNQNLRDFWAKNDTPREQRDKMLRGHYFKHLSDLNDAYHAIPDDDFDAKAGYLKEHPILVHWWMQNNNPADDLEAIINSSNAALRDRYFQYLEAKDYGGAKEWLARFPFIFEFTKAAANVKDGVWIFHGKPRSQHARDYLRAKSALATFFNLLKTSGKGAAYDWLAGNSSEAALVRWYFARYASHGHSNSPKARAYLAAKAGLDAFFQILKVSGKAAAFAWLDKDGQLQQQAKHYFDVYGKHGGSTAKSRAYLHAKPGLDRFFSILDSRGKQAAFDWLDQQGNLQQLAKGYFAAYGKHNATPKGRAYLAAKSGLDKFFSILDTDGKDAAFAWLDKKGELQKQAKHYFDVYGKHNDTPKGRAFLHAKAGLDAYFKIIADEGKQAAFDWLDKDGAKQKLARDYFFDYGHHGSAAQAADFSDAKHALHRYYELRRHDEDAARAWLRAGSPDAELARDYFKKWSRLNQLARKWGGFVNSENPEVNLRLRFWQHYWQLPPDQRMNYVLQHAEEHAVFVWGPIGETKRHDAEQQYLRDALQHHISNKTALYLRIKPLLDLFFTLTSDNDKALMLKANPDLNDYFTKYASRTVTGDKKLDAQVASYFKLPRGSNERADFLKDNPQLQVYFNKKATPGERAMYALLETYFGLPFAGRKRYLFQHPEIQAYFDKRKSERDNLTGAESAFDLADPRLTAFFDEAEHTITEAGLAKQDQLAHAGRRKPKSLTRRVDRVPTVK